MVIYAKGKTEPMKCTVSSRKIIAVSVSVSVSVCVCVCVCVWVCVCVCVYIHPAWNICDFREQINDVVLKNWYFLPGAFIATSKWSTKLFQRATLSCSSASNGPSRNLTSVLFYFQIVRRHIPEIDQALLSIRATSYATQLRRHTLLRGVAS